MRLIIILALIWAIPAVAAPPPPPGPTDGLPGLPGSQGVSSASSTSSPRWQWAVMLRHTFRRVDKIDQDEYRKPAGGFDGDC